MKLCQNTCGAGTDWKDWVVLLMISGRGLSCAATLGGQSPVEGKRHQVGCGGLVRSGMSEYTVCQQANGSVPLFPVENISITIFSFHQHFS